MPVDASSTQETLKQFTERLLSHAQGILIDRAAEQCRPVRDLRQQQLRQRGLVRCFYNESFYRDNSGDDRSIALASRELVD